jgi:hypothetical protein
MTTTTKKTPRPQLGRVITYRLAYLDHEVSLCAACVDADDHGCGTLGPVRYGLHGGSCMGDAHTSRPRVLRDV